MAFFSVKKKYIDDILERSNMSGAKSVPTPMVPSPPLTLQDGSPLPDPT